MPLYYKDNNTWKEFNPNPYPIGTLVSLTKDNSPATLVGGTWTKKILETAYTDFTMYGVIIDANFTWKSNILYGYLAWKEYPNSAGVNNLPPIATGTSITIDSYTQTNQGRPDLEMRGTTLFVSHGYTNTTVKFHYTTAGVNPDVGFASVIYERTA